jgi:hypothetical protein
MEESPMGSETRSIERRWAVLFGWATALAVFTSPVLAQNLPDPALTPGEVDPALTVAILCAPGFSTRTIRSVASPAQKRAIFQAYGMNPNQPPCPCELDHLIPLGIGGSNGTLNLWPQPRSAMPCNSLDKDQIERRLPQEVCTSKIDLLAAQQEIATNWIAAYRARTWRRNGACGL